MSTLPPFPKAVRVNWPDWHEPPEAGALPLFTTIILRQLAYAAHPPRPTRFNVLPSDSSFFPPRRIRQLAYVARTWGESIQVVPPDPNSSSSTGLGTNRRRASLSCSLLRPNSSSSRSVLPSTGLVRASQETIAVVFPFDPNLFFCQSSQIPPSCRQLAYHPPHACGRDRLQSTYAPPSTRPDAAGPSDGEAVISTNRAKDRADAQRLVTTRLLDRLHDPLGHFSRLQRIHPRAR